MEQQNFKITDSSFDEQTLKNVVNDIFTHIFTMKNGCVELIPDYYNVLLSEKINFLEYAKRFNGWADIFDFSVNCFKIKEITPELKNTFKQIMTNDNKLYASHHVYIALQGSIYSHICLHFVGKKDPIRTALGEQQLLLSRTIESKFDELGRRIDISHMKQCDEFNVKLTKLNYDIEEKIRTINHKLDEMFNLIHPNVLKC